jgi:aryl carrier-like protein
VGVHDNFLDLGGHSLTAMRVASRWTHLTGSKLSITKLFDHLTIADLADYVDRNRTVSPDAAAEQPALSLAGQERRPCNLVIVVNEQFGRSSFDLLAREVELADPSIRAVVTSDSPTACLELMDHPTLVFSPALVRNPTRFPGRIVCGQPLAKSEEYSALATAGIPVPAWELLAKDHIPDLSGFGPYVVCKPNDGAKGAAVKLMRRDRVRWKPVFTGASGMSTSLIVQEYIHTGRRPASYRVTTLFGHTLYALRVLAGPNRPPLITPEEMESGRKPAGASIVSNTPDSELELIYDPDVIKLAESAHAAFPEIPLLGVDILREEASGQLFAIEVNAIGYNWNFAGSGPRSLDIALVEQFDGLRKAARILAEQTQRLALPARFGSGSALEYRCSTGSSGEKP